MTTEPMKKEGRHFRRSHRRLAERTKAFEGPSNGAKANREQLERGAVHMPGSLKGHA